MWPQPLLMLKIPAASAERVEQSAAEQGSSVAPSATCLQTKLIWCCCWMNANLSNACLASCLQQKVHVTHRMYIKLHLLGLTMCF